MDWYHRFDLLMTVVEGGMGWLTIDSMWYVQKIGSQETSLSEHCEKRHACIFKVIFNNSIVCCCHFY